MSRTCSKTGCRRGAVATLTYVYSDRAIVLGPLATYAEPHTYDLCHDHATRMTPPIGWEVVHLSSDGYEPIDEPDDLVAVVEAVRERGPVAGRSSTTPVVTSQVAPVGPGARRSHLRVLPGLGE